jgi:hypothetical protein
MSIRTEHPAAGIASIVLGAAGKRLTYRCEPELHRVTATDEFGTVVMAFGGLGRGFGRFNTPLDLAFVRPEFFGEVLPVTGPDAVWLAVADYGNRRVQLFELDGAYVATLDTNDDRAIGAPCALTWRAPVLEVEGVEGRRVRVNLTAALLSEYHGIAPQPREWLFPSARVN